MGLAYNPLPQIESFVKKQQRTLKQQAELRSTEGLEERKIKSETCLLCDTLVSCQCLKKEALTRK